MRALHWKGDSRLVIVKQRVDKGKMMIINQCRRWLLI